MTSTAWTVPIPQERVQEFRDLLADLNKNLSGLAERAREAGYHRERMWLQPNQDGSARLIVHLELNDGVTPAELVARLRSYDSEFTRWWNPRFESFGFPASPGETLLAWSDGA
ncbi:hypothetical protein [Streptomyces sp. NPDC048438]|uniref:hypothetical protein n=1 Tax=Streptomyces sp. NPDC048438 TaxID=3365551 RepID=UPI0037204A1B